MSTAHEDASLTDSLTSLPTPEVLSPTTPVLVTGGLSGTGRVIAEALLGLGVHVISGTRDREKFDRFRPTPGGSEGEPRVSPLIADLTDPRQVREALLRTTDCVPNAHVVLSAAGGMESFSMKLMRGITSISRLKPELQNAALDNFNAEILEQALAAEGEGAYAINYAANINLIEQILEQRDSSQVRYLIVLSSFPSTFYNDGFPVPPFYEGIARSKHHFVNWLKKNFERLVEGGLVPVDVSGHMLIDTGVALIFKALRRLNLEDEVREALNPENFPVKKDLADAVLQVLQGRVKFDELPGKLYVPAPGVITQVPPGQEIIAALRTVPLLWQKQSQE